MSASFSITALPLQRLLHSKLNFVIKADVSLARSPRTVRQARVDVAREVPVRRHGLQRHLQARGDRVKGTRRPNLFVRGRSPPSTSARQRARCSPASNDGSLSRCRRPPRKACQERGCSAVRLPPQFWRRRVTVGPASWSAPLDSG